MTRVRNCYLHSYLGKGSANAVSTERLLKLSGLRRRRELYEQIEYERNHGKLILSDTLHGGYYLPSDGETGEYEISRFYSRRMKQAASLIRTVRAMQNIQLSGQETLEGFEFIE